MRNVKVVVEYDGTDYHGFQYQPDVPTVQGELEKVISKIVKEKVVIYGSGRTDAGVHASGQVINFRTDCKIPIDRVCIAINTLLKSDISAVHAEEVDNDFHSRYSAKSRMYRYSILNKMLRNALQGRYKWNVRDKLDIELMRKAAIDIVGVHDFSGFASPDKDECCHIRNVKNIEIGITDDNVSIEITANAFLRSMVRIIVGTLVEVGLNKRDCSDILDILNARDRRRAGKTAPACGLCLVNVEY